MQKKFLSLVAGLTVTLGCSAEKSAGDVPAVPARIDAIRAALAKEVNLAKDNEPAKSGVAASPRNTPKDLILAQWGNWGNWGNWNNWNNWRNWSQFNNW